MWQVARIKKAAWSRAVIESTGTYVPANNACGTSEICRNYASDILCRQHRRYSRTTPTSDGAFKEPSTNIHVGLNAVAVWICLIKWLITVSNLLNTCCHLVMSDTPNDVFIGHWVQSQIQCHCVKQHQSRQHHCLFGSDTKINAI